MERYKPHEVKNIKCQVCKELLLKRYPWSYVSDVNQEMKIMCGRCYNRSADENKKKKRKDTSWDVNSTAKELKDPLKKYHETIKKHSKLKTE